MIFYLHFILLTSGLSSVSVLLGVFVKAYSDASQGEIGILLMTLPFQTIVIKPLFCSMADKHQQHRGFLIGALTVMFLGYAPLSAIPFFPSFYEQHPRISWYILVLCLCIGNAAIAVAWSLGESLAVNSSQKTNTPYSYMRLTGTISWGIYGYIIGEINEVPMLPKYVPAFLILLASSVLEIILILCWRKEDFIMTEAFIHTNNNLALEQGTGLLTNPNAGPSTINNLSTSQHQIEVDSTPSSVGGTLRLRPETAMAIRDILTSDDFHERLDSLAKNQSREGSLTRQSSKNLDKLGKSSIDLEKNDGNKKKGSSPQIKVFKMILREDGRLIKYITIFILGGILIGPLNFIFLSFEDVCKTKGCNFSHLAGTVLVSQAVSETASFFILPWALRRINRSYAIGVSFIIQGLRFFFYAQFYYKEGVNPYWALIGEWGHGISFSINSAILADVALMFATQCRLFIPEMRRLGYLSSIETVSKEIVEAEENQIKMALRATMQALMSGLMEGLGVGLGSLLCGFLIELYSYIPVWRLFTMIAAVTLVLHQTIEITRCKWSDKFRPKKGTKAYEIMAMSEIVRRKEVINKTMEED